MPFLAKEHFPLSNKDILSWTFDDLQYDWVSEIIMLADAHNIC